MKKKKMLNDMKIQVLFAIYIYILFEIILLKFGSIDIAFLGHQLKMSLGNPDNLTSQLQAGNLTPFKEISRTMHSLSNHGLINLVGNIAIFVPYGIFLGLMLRNKKLSLIGAFLLSLGLSLCLESTQVLFSIGRFDVDDLILNSSGGLIGFIAFKLCVKLVAASSTVIQARERPI